MATNKAAAESAAITAFKKRARNLKRRLDGLGVGVSLQQALEAVAAEEGFKTWAALLAAFSAENNAVGEFKGLWASFAKAPPETPALRGYVAPFPGTCDAPTRNFLSRLQWTCERMQDSVSDFMSGDNLLSGVVCVTGEDHERMDAVEKISRRLFLSTVKVEQGPLDIWNVLDVPGFRSDYSAVYGPTWAPFYDGMHHLSDAPEDYRDLAERALSVLETRLANLPRGRVIFLGFSDAAKIPASIVRRTCAIVTSKEVAHHLQTPFTGVPSCSTSSLRFPDKPHPEPQGLRTYPHGTRRQLQGLKWIANGKTVSVPPVG